MKNIIPLLAIVILLFSCAKEVKKKSIPIKDIPLNERAIPTLPGATSANSVIGGAHYICPKNCVGGTGTSAGKCPVCETEMTHNQGFHVTNNTTPSTPTTPNSATSSGDLPNANGQYHYTCTKGCTGGKGGAGTCDSCGSALEHNTGFHS